VRCCLRVDGLKLEGLKNISLNMLIVHYAIKLVLAKLTNWKHLWNL
jgi:hypothetical protein